MFFNALGEYPPQDQCDKELPACLANFRPMIYRAFYCLLARRMARLFAGAPVGARLAREGGLAPGSAPKNAFAGKPGSYRGIGVQARALRVASICCSTSASPFSPQYKVIICLSASTLYTLPGNFSK